MKKITEKLRIIAICVGLKIKTHIKIIINWLAIIWDKLVMLAGKNNELDFKPLTPTDEAENVEAYIEALEWALANDEIYNIGITAAYCSGKSSFLKTFIKKHPSMNYINISMAMFKDGDSNDIEPYGEHLKSKSAYCDTKVLDCHQEEFEKFDKNVTRIMNSTCEDLLERSILEQLFYKVKNDKIPKSRFQKIYKQSFKKVFLSIISIAMVLTGAFWIYAPDKTVDLFNSRIEIIKAYDNNQKIIFSIAAIVIVIIVVELVRSSLSFISQIDITINGKASITTKGDCSNLNPFSAYMDEILYFFERTNYNIVIFEDMDRFNKPLIFVKLRELNKIINSYEGITQRVIFLYALKDDVFNVENRAKFFDFIIPIIPYMGCNNTYVHMKNEIDALKDKYDSIDISDNFIKKISLYISDIRVLQNIINEFMVYKRTIGIKGDHDEQLFSLIIFKNLYPSEFNELMKGKGLIKEAFKARDIFIDEKVKIIDGEILCLKDKKNAYMDEPFIDMTELKLLWFYKAAQNTNITGFTVDSINYNIEEVLKSNFDMECLIGCTVYYKYGRGYSNLIRLDNIQASDGVTYYKHWQNMYAARIDKQREFNEKIHDKEVEKSRIKIMSLSELDKEYNLENIMPEIKEKNEFLFKLLREAFVDNNYLSYVNLFKDKDIFPHEFEYLCSINAHSGDKKWDVSLFHPGNIISRLTDDQFELPAILNYDLLDYLLSNPDMLPEVEITNKLQNISYQISFSDFAREFAISYYLRKKNSKEFLKKVIRQNHYFWYQIIDFSGTTVEDCQMLLCDLFEIFYFNEIIEQNGFAEKRGEEFSIRYFLRNNPETLLLLQRIDISKLEEVIKAIDVKFTNLQSVVGLDSELISFIRENDLYEISYETMKSLINNEDRKEFENHVYTFLLENEKYECMLEYVSSYPDKLYEVIFDVNNVSNESTEAIWRLANIFNYDTDRIRDIIEKHSFEITEIEALDYDENTIGDFREFIDICVENRRLKPSWDNIRSYTDLFGVTDIISQFIKKAVENQHFDNTNLDDEFISWLIVNDLNNFILYCEHFYGNVIKVDFERGIPLEVVEQLVASKINDARKKELIQKIIPKEYSEILADFCVVNKIILPKEILQNVYRNTSLKYDFISSYHKEFTVDEIKALVVLIEGLEKIFDTSNTEIVFNDKNYSLVRFLKQIGVIEGYNKKRGRLIIQIKNMP